MKVTYKMEVSAEEYFDFIINHLMQELPKSVLKKITKEDIKVGLKYRQTYKLAKGDFVSKKEIVEFVYGEVYKLQITIPDGFQYIEHRVISLDDNTSKVIYEETLETSKSTTNIVHTFRSFSNAKKMKKTLHEIELAIINNRKEAE